VRSFRWMIRNPGLAIAYAMPARLVQYCALHVGAETTTGPYGNTVVPELGMLEAINRFARIHALGGAGKDRHFDSNRKRGGTPERPALDY